MVRKSARSRSRGRTETYSAGDVMVKQTPKAKKAKPAKVPEPAMDFAEGAAVMARWPGSSLFFKAKVTLLREEEQEYDVEFENGTVYTLKAKDVYKASSKIMKKAPAPTRGRSKSKGRAGRPKSKAATEEPKAEEPTAETATDAAVDEAPKVAPAPKAAPAPKPKKEKPVVTPSRISRRIADKAATDAFSDDESDSKVKLAPNPELPDARGKKKAWSFEWVWALIFMILGPAILISLHTLCTKASCKLETPKISTDLKTYFNLDAFGMFAGFWALLKLLKFIPVGATVNGSRMNGFASLLVLLSAVPALVYYKVPLGAVKANYFYFMSTAICLSFFSAIVFYVLSRWENKTALNSKGNTGNPIVDIFNGRTLSPRVLGYDVKLLCFRYSMIGLAVLNVLMVTDSIVAAGGKASPTVILASAFQVLYAMDAMFFEEYYFHSHDAMNSGFGWSLISSYATFPFLPTLVTRYLLDRSPEVAWYYLVLIGLMNAVGYVIYRSSESQRCEFAKDPSNPNLAHLETVSTAGNRKLLVSGWWGLVRHPNYLGELLVQWSWVLPAGN